MDFPKQRGMICNKEKTELITFLETPPFNIEPKQHIKALGITLDNKL